MESPSRITSWDLPGSPGVQTSPSNAGGAGLIPDWRAKILYVSGPRKHKTEAAL